MEDIPCVRCCLSILPSLDGQSTSEAGRKIRDSINGARAWETTGLLCCSIQGTVSNPRRMWHGECSLLY